MLWSFSPVQEIYPFSQLLYPLLDGGGVGQRYVGGAIEAGGGADGLFEKGNESGRRSDRDEFLPNNPSILPIKPPV